MSKDRNTPGPADLDTPGATDLDALPGVDGTARDDAGGGSDATEGQSEFIGRQSMFATTPSDSAVQDADEASVNLGVRFSVLRSGRILGVRFLKTSQNTGTHTGALWSASGGRLASATFTGESSSGWQEVQFSTAVPVVAGTSYVVSYLAPRGRYAATQDFFTTPWQMGDLVADSDSNGLYAYGATLAFPTMTHRSSNYWVDPVFTADFGSVVTRPAPAPSPTATPVQVGWPGPGNTGVPAGTVLTSRSSFTVTTDGAVIDSVQVNGTLTIRANNVTVRNSKIVGGWINVGSYQRGIMITDTEIDGRNLNAYGQGIGYNGYTCIRCNIHSIGRGINASGDVVLRDSWIHDMNVAGDPATTGSHNEAVLSNGGDNITIVGNRLDSGRQGNFSASLAFYGDFAPITNVLVEKNRFVGGGFCVYAGSVPSKPYPRASNAKFLNNTFARDIAPNCGFYGTGISYFNGNGNQWSGNHFEGGGTVGTPSFS